MDAGGCGVREPLSPRRLSGIQLVRMAGTAMSALLPLSIIRVSPPVCRRRGVFCSRIFGIDALDARFGACSGAFRVFAARLSDTRA